MFILLHDSTCLTSDWHIDSYAHVYGTPRFAAFKINLVKHLMKQVEITVIFDEVIRSALKRN